MPKLNSKYLYILSLLFAFLSTACGVKNYSRFSYHEKYKTDSVSMQNAKTSNPGSSSKGYYYTVQKGDSLWHISQVTGVLVDSIKEANKIIHTDKLYTGLKLYIPKVHDPYAQFSWPAKGAIYSGYGPRGKRFHHGIDIGAQRGDIVKAAAPGKVIYADYNRGGFGNLVKISHFNGEYITYYAHNDKIFVQKGDYVRAGEAISKVGMTGRTTGPHLHFEIHKQNGQTINPLTQLEPRIHGNIRLSRK